MFRGGNRFRGYKFSVADPSSGGCTENRRLKVDENQKRLAFFLVFMFGISSGCI